MLEKKVSHTLNQHMKDGYYIPQNSSAIFKKHHKANMKIFFPHKTCPLRLVLCLQLFLQHKSLCSYTQNAKKITIFTADTLLPLIFCDRVSLSHGQLNHSSVYKYLLPRVLHRDLTHKGIIYHPLPHTTHGLIPRHYFFFLLTIIIFII